MKILGNGVVTFTYFEALLSAFILYSLGTVEFDEHGDLGVDYQTEIGWILADVKFYTTLEELF